MTPNNRYVVRRFALKTAILIVFALAQWRQGIALTLAVLFGMASMIDIGLAVIGKTPFHQAHLSYWDEAAAFLVLCVIATAGATR